MRDLSPALAVYLLFVAFITGLVFGSFCNAWAWRLAHGERITKGRSHCPKCNHVLQAIDLVPLFSFLVLRGRCRYCGARISWRYPAAELASALLFVSVALRFPVTEPLTILRWLIVGCLLLTLSLVDLETFEIPDRLLVGIVLAFVICTPITSGLDGVKSGIIGALAVSVPLLVFVLLADKVMGRETMGGGDIKLLAALGLHFGAANMLLLLIVACILGVLIAYFTKNGEESTLYKPIPFGPAIAGAAWVVMLFGSKFLAWYLQLFI